MTDLLSKALFNDIPVGNVCCKFEKEDKDTVKLYIMTLGCLAPYRRLGIATKVRRYHYKEMSIAYFQSISYWSMSSKSLGRVRLSLY
jgi:hypothetical protein